MNNLLAIALLSCLYFAAAAPQAIASSEDAITELENLLSAQSAPPVAEPQTDGGTMAEQTQAAEAIIEQMMAEEIPHQETSDGGAPANAALSQPMGHDAHENIEPEAATASPQTIPESHPHTPWSYSGATAPGFWGSLSEEYSLCATGKEQSPVDITLEPIPPEPETSLALNYATVPFEVENNGHSIQVNYPAGSTATIGESTYELKQFHFHHPSEHTINGEVYAMEVHFVHRNKAGNLAVISALVQPGEANDDITMIWGNIPAVGEKQGSDLLINARNLLPENLEPRALYLGSLTTPPCTEGVTWIVTEEPISLSAEQIDAFQALYSINNRPVQRSAASAYESE